MNFCYGSGIAVTVSRRDFGLFPPKGPTVSSVPCGVSVGASGNAVSSSILPQSAVGRRDKVADTGQCLIRYANMEVHAQFIRHLLLKERAHSLAGDAS